MLKTGDGDQGSHCSPYQILISLNEETNNDIYTGILMLLFCAIMISFFLFNCNASLLFIIQ